MLKELSKYENLGTPTYFHELLSLLQDNQKKWTCKEVSEYFSNRIIDGRNIFDGCLHLLQSIGVITIDMKKFIFIEPIFLEYLRNDNYFNAKILEWFFREMKEDFILYSIFSSPNISYDIIYHSIQVNNSAFHFKYANIKQFLIDFDFLQPHPDKQIRKLVINPRFRKIFDINILPEVKRRKVGIEELREQLERKMVLGEEAEVFVLEFEKERLNSERDPEWVSPYWVDAGYDIASYEDITSEEINRFIEVKSFSGTPTFYWSRNEIDVAKLKKGKYFLYLVDRNKMNENGYSPLIIQNPYEVVLKNDLNWNKLIDKYFITSLN